MPRQRSQVTKSEALRLAYEAAASILDGALAEGFDAASGQGYDAESVEGRRINAALDNIAGMLHGRAISRPRRRRFFGLLLAGPDGRKPRSDAVG